MRLLLDNRTPGFRLRPRALAGAAQAMAKRLRLHPSTVVSLVLCPVRALSRLGGKHFGRPQVTDVIAFPTGFDDLAGGMLGELWIAPETVGRNGLRFGKGLNGEFLFVLAHGLLHLLGHDDSTERERLAMFARQEELLTATRTAGQLPLVVQRTGSRGPQ